MEKEKPTVEETAEKVQTEEIEDELSEEETGTAWGTGRRIGVVAGSVLAVTAVCFIAFCLYYRNRWYPGTTIAEIEVSGKTMEESRQYVLDQYKGYSLQITGRDGHNMSISDSDIDFVVNAGSDWDETFSNQHENSIVPIAKSEGYESALEVSYDENALKKLISESELVRGSGDSPIQKPVSAKVVFDKKKNQYVCKSEIQGNQVVQKELLKAVADALSQCRTQIDLTQEEQYSQVYKKPKVTSEDESLQEQMKKCNNAVLRYISWTMAKGVKEKLTPGMISKWITYKNDKVKFNDKKIEQWVKDFCGKYDTVGKTRTIKSHTGKKVKVPAGDYGWQMDYGKTLTQVKKALKKKMPQKYINAYLKDPDAANKKALTLLRKPVYLNTAYQWNSDNPAGDWDTKNFIEICLGEQMVYVIRNGKVKFSCRCISGLPVKGRQTRTGAFYLKEHLPEHTMVGADYRTHVRYWVRITWTGTGFHPATWQPWSRWSKTLYRSRGSHGCINLSPSDAVSIYNLTKYHEAVFIHN